MNYKALLYSFLIILAGTLVVAGLAAGLSQMSTSTLVWLAKIILISVPIGIGWRIIYVGLKRNYNELP